MLQTKITFSKHINKEELAKYFEDYPCDGINYGINELNFSTVTIKDKYNVSYFSSSFLDIMKKTFDVKDIEILITIEDES